MSTSVSTKGLIKTIERRLAAISEQQHALALERTRLLEHVTPLRLGVLAPETALVLLRSAGITLPGVGTGDAASRRPRDIGLRAVPRSAVASPSGTRVLRARRSPFAQRPCQRKLIQQPIAATRQRPSRRDLTAPAAGSARDLSSAS